MSRNKIYVVEDIAINRRALILTLKNAGYDIVGSSGSAENALKDISKQNPDLAILDINLEGEKDGIWLANQLKSRKITTQLLFLTAYGDKNTIEKLLELDMVGYIMKPYNEATLLVNIKLALKNNTKQFQSLVIRQGYDNIKIPSHLVQYINSDGNYVKIITKEKTLTVRDKLEVLQKQLPDNSFVRIHRRYLVNIDSIESYNSDQVILKNERLPISRTYKTETLFKINQFQMDNQEN